MLDKLYQATPDGYCGDEDNGQTSAWYVFSAMGFYPVTPGTTQYVIGSPLFDEVIIHFKNGKTFTITSEGNSKENVYIQSAKLNGKDYNKSWLEHSDIMNGGKLVFRMHDELTTSIGGEDHELKPYSLSREN